MYPDRDTALRELNIANELNPGGWTEHCFHVGEAAKIIARHAGLDAEKAFVCGLLHDIGRREGVMKMRHIIEGYNFCMSKGWDEIARICLTHSYPIKDIKKDIAPVDITEEQYAFVDKYLQETEYDDYDKLIILCDSLAVANGFCTLNLRFVDTTRRYGVFQFTLERWEKTIEYKEYFEEKIGQPIYKLLPDIEESIYW